MSSIETQKQYISIARNIMTELGIIREGTSIRLESITPVFSIFRDGYGKESKSENGYDVGISVTVGEPNIFGEVERQTYVVRLDKGENFVKLWREEK